MNRRDEKLLTRHLAGETTSAEESELAAKLAGDPELAMALARLRRAWTGLELPPPAPAPPGFAGRVRVRIAGLSAAGELIGPAPVWARVAAAAALVAGVALGAGVGALDRVDQTANDGALVGDDLGSDAIAGAYLEALAGSANALDEEAR